MEKSELVIKKMSVVFLIIFIGIIVLPLLKTNLKNGVVSTAENRTLTAKPELYNEEGNLNTNFITDFENWFNDNVGFRSEFVLANAKIQYEVFERLSDSNDYYLGPNGELNYATSTMLRDYAHVNLLSEEELRSIETSYQVVNDYLEQKNINFYYFQCWDKHSIYPEYFMAGVNQYGEISSTDQIVNALVENTTVNVISPKELLISVKGEYDTYSVWGDATHWNQRGAYISYLMLMNEINEETGKNYKVLQEDDYQITLKDQGSTMFGGVHEIDYQEDFIIIDSQACQTGEPPLYLSQWQRDSRSIFVNDSVNNRDTILIVGDSYFDNFIVDDIAESFYRTVLVWGDYTKHLPELVEYYEPAIVVCENAERAARWHHIVTLAEEFN